MFDGVQQDQFHQFLATTTSTATSRPIHTSTIPSSAHSFSLSSNPPFTLHHPHLHPHHHDSIRTTAAATYPVSFVDHYHNPLPLADSHHHHQHQVPLPLVAPHFLHQQQSSQHPPTSTPLPLQLQVHHHQVHKIINNGEIKEAAAAVTHDGLTTSSRGDDINGGLLSVAGGNIMIKQEMPAVSLLQHQEEMMDNPCTWSNEEVLTLLRIRSSMENWFPNLTWEHVSRRLADHGFKRSTENCKQKFEEERRYFKISNGSRSAPTAPATANTIPAASIISNKNNYTRLFCNDIDEGEDLYNTHQHQHQHHDNIVVHHHFDQQQTQNSHQSPIDHNLHDHHQNNDSQRDTQQSAHDANDCNGHQISSGNDEEGQKGDESHEEVVQVATVDIDEKEEDKMRQQRSVEEAVEAADSAVIAIVAAATDIVVVDDQEDHHQQSVDEDNSNNPVCSIGHNHDDRHNNDNEMIEKTKRSSTTSSSSRSNKRKIQNHNHGHYGHHQSSKKKFEMFKGFCAKIMNQMMSQQEELHNKILEDMVKRDEENIAREEAWKKQEIDRINKEMEGRAREQAAAGDRQARIIEFLKQFTSDLHENNNTSIKVPNISIAAPATIDIASASLLLDKIASTTQTTPPILTDSSSPMIQTSFKSPSSMISTDQYTSFNMSTPADHEKSTSPMSPSSNVNQPNSQSTDANSVIPTEGDIVHPPMSPAITSKTPRVKPQQSIVRYNPNSNSTDYQDTGKRWPRDEVLTLINIRCSLYNNNSGGTVGTHANVDENNNPSSNKAPLWERISQKMLEVGYKRSAKRCKEKWENINKYFRKTKDSNKKRSVDSRTCPYFHQLSHLYSQGAIGGSLDNHASGTNSSVNNHWELPELAASTDQGRGNGGLN